MNATRIEEIPTESRGSSFEGSVYPSQRLPRLFAGDRLGRGRFEIRNRLGSGGMGIVYEAYDVVARRRVALKTGHLLHPEVTYRLKGEFRALRGVQHPNLVQLYELFAEEGLWYFTMERVDGDTFETWLATPAASHPQLRGRFSQLAHGVNAIHRAGKVHRDLKPSNLIVSPEDRVVILDYGLVTDAVPWTVGHTQNGGRFSGTPAYSAPEQLYGGPASKEGDWYAFGVILYQALTGELPCSSSNLLAYLKASRVPYPQNLRPGASADLVALCLRLLENDPSQRPHFEEVAAVLGERRTTTAVTPSLSLERRWSEEHPLLDRELHATRKGRMRVLAIADVGTQIEVTAELRALSQSRRSVVLRGSYHHEESIPYNGLDGIVDDLSHHLAKQSRDQAAALLPRDVSELAQLFPVLNRVDVVAEFPRRIMGEANSRQRCSAALSEMISRICDRQPVVLLIDGLQHADDETLKLAEAILGGEPLPVLVVLLLSKPFEARLQPLVRALRRCPWAQLNSLPGQARKLPHTRYPSQEPFAAESSAA